MYYHQTIKHFSISPFGDLIQHIGLRLLDNNSLNFLLNCTKFSQSTLVCGSASHSSLCGMWNFESALSLICSGRLGRLLAAHLVAAEKAMHLPDPNVRQEQQAGKTALNAILHPQID